MFKYIKEILMTVSPAQRLWALTILLFSISLMTIGPKIVESFTQTDTELKAITDRQKEQILLLNNELVKTNSEIIKGKTECTNLVIQREKEILQMIEELQRGMYNRNLFKTDERGPASGSTGESDYQIINGDTVRISRSYAPSPKQIEDDGVPMMLEGLDRIKNKLKKDINKSIQ